MCLGGDVLYLYLITVITVCMYSYSVVCSSKILDTYINLLPNYFVNLIGNVILPNYSGNCVKTLRGYVLYT